MFCNVSVERLFVLTVIVMVYVQLDSVKFINHFVKLLCQHAIDVYYVTK